MFDIAGSRGEDPLALQLEKGETWGEVYQYGGGGSDIARVYRC